MMFNIPGTNCIRFKKDISISEKNIEILKTIERLALVSLNQLRLEVPGQHHQSAGMSSGSSQDSTIR